MTPRHKTSEREETMQETRRQLLEAAAEEFARHGPDKANVNRIAEAAGFSVGTVYNYFPGKQALLTAVVDETARIHYDMIAEAVRSEDASLERLERFYQAGFEFVRRHLPRARVLFDVVNGSDESLKAHIFGTYQPMFQLVAEEILAPGMKQGAFKPTDPATMATLLMTIYLGTAAQHDAEGNPWLDPARVAELVLYGLAKSGGER